MPRSSFCATVPVVSVSASPSSRSAIALPEAPRARGFCVNTPVKPKLERPFEVANVRGRIHRNSPLILYWCLPRDHERLSAKSKTPDVFCSGLLPQQGACPPRPLMLVTLKLGVPEVTARSNDPGISSLRGCVPTDKIPIVAHEKRNSLISELVMIRV